MPSEYEAAAIIRGLISHLWALRFNCFKGSGEFNRFLLSPPHRNKRGFISHTSIGAHQLQAPYLLARMNYRGFHLPANALILLGMVSHLTRELRGLYLPHPWLDWYWDARFYWAAGLWRV